MKVAFNPNPMVVITKLVSKPIVGIYITPNQSSKPNPKPEKLKQRRQMNHKNMTPTSNIYNMRGECTHASYKYITHRFQEINGMINKEILTFWFTLCDPAFEVIT